MGSEKIKTFITTDTIEINEKFVKQYVIRNFARLIATSNTVSALPIDFRSGDRRFVLFEAKRFSINGIEYEVNTPKHSEYFKQFYEVINSSWYPRYMFDKMMSIDISNWNHDQKFETSLKNEMMFVSRNSVEHFVFDKINTVSKLLVNSQSIDDLENQPDHVIDVCKPIIAADNRAILVKVHGQDLYNEYKDFCEESSCKTLSKTSFYRFLLEMERKTLFIYRYYGHNGVTFIVNKTRFDRLYDNNVICEF